MSGLKHLAVAEKFMVLAASAVSPSCACVPIWVRLEASDALLCRKAQRKQGRGFSASSARMLSFFLLSFKSGGDLGFALTFVNEI